MVSNMTDTVNIPAESSKKGPLNRAKDIAQNLTNLGLSNKEVEVYMALLNSKAMTILEISEVTNIPRSTVYHLAERLVDKKFARWILEHKSTSLEALRPDDLTPIVNEKKDAFETASESLSELQKMVKSLTVNVPKTQVRYYQGREGIKQILWNTLKAEKEVVGYSEFGRISVTERKFYNEYVREFRNRGLTDRVVCNELGFDYIRKHVIDAPIKHQLEETSIKVIPQKIFYVSGDHSLYNNTYSICYWKKGEIVGVEIENEELVKMHKSIFEILWKTADPLSKHL